MIFRQLLDYETYTYTYILGCDSSREAAIIDSVVERVERDVRIIEELGLRLKYIMETHIHADHVTGANRLKNIFPYAQSVVSKWAGAEYGDIKVKDGDVLKLGNKEIKVLGTPGHTNGCTSYHVEDKVFTGDTLLIRGCGRTDFQQGSAEVLFASVREKLFTLPEATLVYPAHDYNGRSNSSIGEEKSFNPRLKSDNSKEDFIRIMSDLKLDPPKKIDVAVPANLVGGS